MSEFELLTVSSGVMTPAQVGDVIALCSEVFETDYSFYMNLDLESSHVLGYTDGCLVAHALWLNRPLPRWGWAVAAVCRMFEGVATHPDYQGRGYGSAVMRRLRGRDPGLRSRHAFPADTGLVRKAGLGALARAAVHRQRRGGDRDIG